MSKKSLKQKPQSARVAIVTNPRHVEGTKNVTARKEGKKKIAGQSKSDRVLSMLKQSSGSTLDELMKATKWQAHSVRGFLSGAVKKRKGLTVVSERDGEGTRRYRIAAEPGV